MKTVGFYALLIVGAATFIVLAYFALAHVLMWAWSLVLVPLLHWPQLEFWPAIGILVILALLGVGTAKQK